MILLDTKNSLKWVSNSGDWRWLKMKEEYPIRDVRIPIKKNYVFDATRIE